MQTVDRNTVREMIERDEATLVEVLGRGQYRKFHLPGALNVPLREDFDRQIQEVVPDKAQPVIVYCSDEDCKASPTAAKRMTDLGYERVYDYSAGKLDWKEAGLPIEGEGREVRQHA